MKKFFLSLSILLAGFSAAKAQVMHILNTTPCTVSFAIHGHDGSGTPGCGQGVTTIITLPPGGNRLWNDVTGLNNCASTENWQHVCMSGFPPMVAVGSWDFIDQLSGFSTIFGPSGGCAGFPSVSSIPGCPGHTVTWTNTGGNADVHFN